MFKKGDVPDSEMEFNDFWDGKQILYSDSHVAMHCTQRYMSCTSKSEMVVVAYTKWWLPFVDYLTALVLSVIKDINYVALSTTVQNFRQTSWRKKTHGRIHVLFSLFLLLSIIVFCVMHCIEVVWTKRIVLHNFHETWCYGEDKTTSCVREFVIHFPTKIQFNNFIPNFSLPCVSGIPKYRKKQTWYQ